MPHTWAALPASEAQLLPRPILSSEWPGAWWRSTTLIRRESQIDRMRRKDGIAFPDGWVVGKDIQLGRYLRKAASHERQVGTPVTVRDCHP